jgi:hypothetical protein
MTGEQLLAARVLGHAGAARISQELDRRAREGLTDSYSAVLHTVASIQAAQSPPAETASLTTAA